MRLGLVTLTFIAVTLAASGAASAQTFEYGKAEEVKEVKEVVWTASAEGGLTVTTGNSRTTTLVGGLKASRKDAANKLTAAGSLTYARSKAFVGTDLDGDGFLAESEIARPSTTTAEAWEVLLRYDRFLTEHNSLYALGKAAADVPAGKQLVGGGQAGYSRLLVANDAHQVVAETGYDFSYEEPVAGDGVAIHSVRLFAGYQGKPREHVGVTAAFEALLNVNSLDTNTGEVGAFEDARLTGKADVTTQLFGDLSLSVSFQLKFDNAPPARPPLGLPYVDGFVPEADKVDTITKVTLVYAFL